MKAEEYFDSIGLSPPVMQRIAGMGVVLILEGVRRQCETGWAYGAVGKGDTEEEATAAIINLIAGQKLLVPWKAIFEGRRRNLRPMTLDGKHFAEFHVPAFVAKTEKVLTKARSTEVAVLAS